MEARIADPSRARGACLALLALTVLATNCQQPPGPAEDAGTVPDADSSAPPPEAGPTEPIGDVRYRLNDEIESVVYFRWEQNEPATSFVRYRFAGGGWAQTPSEPRAAGAHEQIVLGIPFETDFEARVIATLDDGEHPSELVTGTTGVIPEEMVIPELHLLDDTAVEPSGRYLFGSVVPSNGQWNPSGPFWAYIIDRRGRLVWARRTPNLHATVYARVSMNGRDLLIDDNTFWFNFDASLAKVHRLKIDGSVVATYDTPGLHHPFTELPDGTIVWGATRNPAEETLEEVTADGQRRTIWDSAEFLSATAPDPEIACFQSNALSWDQQTDTFLFSSFCDFYVVQIARVDGSVVRVFGGDLPQAFRTSPETPMFWQHGVVFTEERTLLTAMHEFESGNEAVVREYAIDDVTKTLRQVWSWKDGRGTRTLYAGEAHRLPNGNTLVNYGTTPLIREVTPEGDIIWEIGWSEQSFVGRSVFLDDLYPFAP